ncbi:hypothetical protein [Nocardia vaccinii]|uniref:hypothetical protein n=1 Tax=Nocardia vaccinii TaxID=1822 RepID=UPI000AE21AFB|nr:hypothetical protein [Nocardia vaccinii]
MTKRTNASAATIAYLAAVEQLIIAMPDGKLFISADILNMMRANGSPELRERRNVGPTLLRPRRRGHPRSRHPRQSRRSPSPLAQRIECCG